MGGVLVVQKECGGMKESGLVWGECGGMENVGGMGGV
jgi:hypothetical protein